MKPKRHQRGPKAPKKPVEPIKPSAPRIPRPRGQAGRSKGGFNLQHEIGLADDHDRYLYIMVSSFS